MTQLSKLLFAGVYLVCSPLTVHAQSPATGATHGNWQVICPDNERCRMAQTIQAKASKISIVRMRVFKSEKPTAVFTFPLGIRLNTGWSFRIDRSRETVLPFELCNTDGCHAGINLTPKLLGSLRRGNTLTLRITDASGKPVRPALSLDGFTKAYKALK